MNNVMERLDASLAAKTYVAWISFVNAVKTPILTMDGGRPVTVINFPDGSKIRATYSNDLKTWVAIPESAQDMHGNPIPLKKEDFAKDGQPTVYEFPGGIGSAAYMDFSRYAFDLGIRTSFTQGDIELVCSNTYFAEHMRWELLCSAVDDAGGVLTAFPGHTQGARTRFRAPSSFMPPPASDPAPACARTTKKGPHIAVQALDLLPTMVGTAGFEPTTLCPPGRCATRLRYAPMMLVLSPPLSGPTSITVLSVDLFSDEAIAALLPAPSASA